MRLTTKGRFAVTALLDVALSEDTASPVSLSAVSERQDISLSYLEQLFGKCAIWFGDQCAWTRWRVQTISSDAEISVADIIVAVDEPIDARQCEGKEDCKGGQQCMTHHLWMDLNRKMFHYLSSVSLADLVKEQNQRMELREGAEKVTRKNLCFTHFASING